MKLNRKPCTRRRRRPVAKPVARVVQSLTATALMTQTQTQLFMVKYRILQVSLSLISMVLYLYTSGGLFHVEWCIR